jgi:hypothetical protein
MEMKRNASPGPDGFNVEFYLATWSWIRDDVYVLVRSFFETGILPAHINDTHIALILKKLVPLIPVDYRPVSLCNVVYKLIAKSLANRVKPHLSDYIHPAQQAFIEGCPISNNIIVAQEITQFSIVINGQPFAKFQSDRESDKDVLYHHICLSLQLMSCQLLYRGHDYEFSYRNCSRKKLPAYPFIAIC